MHYSETLVGVTGKDWFQVAAILRDTCNRHGLQTL